MDAFSDRPFLNAEAFRARAKDGASVDDILVDHSGVVVECDAEAVLAKAGDLDQGTIEQKAEEVGARDVRIVYSSGIVDRHGDTIKQNGIDLKFYRKNPVVGFAHFSPFGHPGGSSPVGRSKKLMDSEDGSKSISIDRFVPAEMPVVGELAEMTFRMLTHPERFLRAASIGFRPKKYSFVDPKDEPERTAEYFYPIDFQEVEKLEHSIVPIPANPECLVGAKAAGIDVRPLKGWAEAVLEADPETLVLSRKALEEAYSIANGNAKTFYIRLKHETGLPLEGEDPYDRFVAALAPEEAEVIDYDKLAALVAEKMKSSGPAAPVPPATEAAAAPLPAAAQTAGLKESVDRLSGLIERALTREPAPAQTEAEATDEELAAAATELTAAATVKAIEAARGRLTN